MEKSSMERMKINKKNVPSQTKEANGHVPKFTLYSQWEQQYKALMNTLSVINLQHITQDGKYPQGIYLCKPNSFMFDEKWDADAQNFKRHPNDPSKAPVIDSIGLYFGKEIVNMYSHAAGDETCQKYFDKLKQISETKEQQLGEDQKRILLENLESQRQKLHNEAAQHIIDYAKNHLSHKKIAIAQEEARKIFEVLYYLWQDTKEDTVTFTGDEFDLLYNKNVLREFKETVKKRTGTKFHLESCVVSGFHNNDPVSNYIFTIKGQNTKSAKAEIRKIMQEIISKHKPRN